MKKRILSILLCCVMLVGLLPTVALAEGTGEQFNLTLGKTYWFDLSGENIFGTERPGTPNSSVPDASLHYVRFTYAGTVDAYVLNSSSSGHGDASGAASQTTDENAQYGYTYRHSLFASDYVLTTGRKWDELNAEGLIFGRSYTSGSVDYTLRAPSVGCREISSGGEPSNNEWDSVLNKKLIYIPCYVDDIYSWGQDSGSEWTRAARGLKTYPRAWGSTYSYYSRPANFGYRPFLEVLNTDELGPDGLKAVTLDLNGGSLGGSSRNIQIVVKNGATFTAPASEGLTRPDGDTGSAFFWLASDGKLYAPGASVPAGVTSLTAQWSSDEQFNLTPGGTYWFDLSGENIPGPVNEGNRDKEDPVPDTTLHYVPFTYAGTVDAYVLNSSSSEKTQAAQDASQTTEKNAQYGYTYPHSLFVSDYVLTHTYVGWAVLNEAGLIFGRSYTSGSVDYTLRAPSAGSSYTGSGDSMRGTPLNNEWDAVLNKDSGYIKYWNGVYSWGQDTRSDYYRNCAIRGSSTVRNWFSRSVYTSPSMYDGFRPVLEVLNPDILGSDGLKAVTLDLNGGSLGGSTENIQIIVKKGATFTAPASEGLTRPDGDTGSAFFWQASDGKLYAPGASVPAGVTLLTAQWTSSTDPDTYTVSFNSQGGSVVDSQNVKSGETATEPTTVPTRAGFDFGGWYTNADCTTKYDFSTPVTGNLILYAKWTLNTYTVTINAGANMALASGNANQSGLSGAMTDTVYTAADGCYFPTDYAVEAVNGISVTRNSYTQITVSGTPTANTTITLAPATAKTKEDTPTATFDAQGPDFGNLNGISQGIKYSLDGGISWTEHTSSDTSKAISGVSADKDIKVYMPASDPTKLDSDIQTIDVTKSATPTGVIGVACTTSANNDGKLQNVTTEMQYKKSDASNWTDCGGTEVTELADGTYYVRVKANGTALASDYQTVTVAAYTAPVHTHSWAEDWSKNDTHHWHECTAAGCGVTDNAKKQGYGAHSGTDDGDCTTAVICECGYIITAANAEHTAGDWITDTPATATTDGTKHKECTVCHRVLETGTIPATGYTITFDAGRWGTASADTAPTGKDGKLTSLPTASRSGYRFNGWYTAVIGGDKITKDTVFDANTTVYAHWTKKTTGGSSGSGSAPAKTPVQSVDTGDMGIALYAGMALLSLTGGAWVVNKKRKGK